jgi:tRNA-2-methylthio-N6-dimethylallyladenosine synthase
MNTTPQKTVYIRTFGCQMNEHDSLKIKLMLVGMGYVSTDTPNNADLILYNTCTIREKAHHKAVSELGRAKDFKESRPDCIVGICGCVAQQDGEALLERFPGVDFAFGPDQIPELPRLIGEAIAGKRTMALELIDDPATYVFLDQTPDLSKTDISEQKPHQASAFVSIMKGCNCACSYCIVPSVRGREVCRTPSDIISEIALLADSGIAEVVLLGQNVNAYDSRRSKGFVGDSEGMRLAELIRRISSETDVSRIRFTSPHPRDVDEELIKQFADNEKLMPHMHLPLQSGSDAMLKKMRRGYKRDRYLEIASELRATRPGMSITTDIIAGFCGESESDFEDTLDVMNRVKFDSIFAFKYSTRPGTEAALKFDDDVSEAVKSERLARVLDLGRATTRQKNELMVGKKSEALVMKCGGDGNVHLKGRLPDNRIIHFTGHADHVGHIVPVQVTKANDNSLGGEAIE